MDPLNQNNQPAQQAPMNGSPASPAAPQANGGDENGRKKVGPIIATLIIILILVIAALYVFASRLDQPAIPTDSSTADSSSYASQTATDTQSVQPVTDQSDDVQSLQSDLNVSTQGVSNQNF